MQDWNYLETSCFEITVEMNCHKFCYANDLAKLWDEHKYALIGFIAQVQLFIREFYLSFLTLLIRLVCGEKIFKLNGSCLKTIRVYVFLNNLIGLYDVKLNLRALKALPPSAQGFTLIGMPYSAIQSFNSRFCYKCLGLRMVEGVGRKL